MRRFIAAIIMAALSLAVASVVLTNNQHDQHSQLTTNSTYAMATVVERTKQQQEAMKFEMDALVARLEETKRELEKIADITAQIVSGWGLPGYLGAVTVGQAKVNGIADPWWIVAVIGHESGGDPDVTNENTKMIEAKDVQGNAIMVEVVTSVDYGLMQINSGTAPDLARRLGIKDFTLDMLFDPELNIRMGALYLGDMLRLHHGDIEKALGAYNRGPGGYNRYMTSRGGVTRTDYSDRVMGQLVKLAGWGK